MKKIFVSLVLLVSVPCLYGEDTPAVDEVVVNQATKDIPTESKPVEAAPEVDRTPQAVSAKKVEAEPVKADSTADFDIQELDEQLDANPDVLRSEADLELTWVQRALLVPLRRYGLRAYGVLPNRIQLFLLTVALRMDDVRHSMVDYVRAHWPEQKTRAECGADPCSCSPACSSQAMCTKNCKRGKDRSAQCTCDPCECDPCTCTQATCTRNCEQGEDCSA